MKLLFVIIGFSFLAMVLGILFGGKGEFLTQKPSSRMTSTPQQPASPLDELKIIAMREKSYPGNNVTTEKVLPDEKAYHRYVISYQSEGNKIFALLTIPIGPTPKNGWPLILVNHGYIPPNEYSTTSSYAQVVDALSNAGYAVFKPDYRGNGNSQGMPSQVYISDGYVTDSLNGLASIKNYPGINPSNIGVWGHSMGGNITLHELVISSAFKSAVIWSGVVGNYTQILDWWKTRIQNHSIVGNDLQTAQIIQQILSREGSPCSHPSFWNSIDPTHYLSEINVPVQIQVGTADTTVPPSFSESLAKSLQDKGKTVEFHEFQGADHNLVPDDALALQQTSNFFQKYLK